VEVDECLKGLRAQQRRIAVRHEDRVAVIRYQGKRLHDGVAGPALFDLLYISGLRADELAHAVGAMPNYEDGRGDPGLVKSVEDILDDGLPAHAVQNFGKVRTDARALPRRQHHGVHRFHRALPTWVLRRIP
jgi:hypothetical protein